MKKFLFLFFLTSICYAQSNDLYYLSKWIDTDDGLNQLSVRNCIEDNNGFMYIATELGLYKYDGKKVILVEDPNYPEISNKRIFFMAYEDRTQTLYFTTHPDLKSYAIVDGKITEINYNKLDGLFFSENKFISASNKALKPLYTHLKSNTFFDNKIKKFIPSSILYSNYFYYGTFDHIGCYDLNKNETKFKFNSSSFAYLMHYKDAVIAINGDNLISIKGSKLGALPIAKDQIITNFLKENRDAFANTSLFSYLDNYFLNFQGNIYKILFDGTTLFTKFLFKAPLGCYVSDIWYSKKNDLYFVATTTKGVALFKPKAINTFTTENEKLNHNYVVVENNGIWYSTNGWTYDRKKNKTVINKLTNFSNNNRFLLTYNGRNYYESTDGTFISIEDLKSVAPLTKQPVLYNAKGFTYLNKKLWVSFENAMGYLEGNTFVYDPFVSKIYARERTFSTLESYNDKLIIGTSKGVFLYKPFTTSLLPIKGLENVNARYCKRIDNTSFWIGCYGEGLFIVKNNKAHKVIDENIDLNTAHAIEEDKNGNLWISTNNGLLTIDKKTMFTNTLNNLPIACYRFTVDDGLLTNEFNGGSTHPSLKTQDGIIGFPSMNGFVYFNPQKVKKHAFSSAIIIDDIISDNANRVPFKNGSYTIDADAKILKINFSYGYHFNRDNLTLSYKYEDQNKWTDITGNTLQIGRYKKGVHKLLIRITTHGFDYKNDIVKSVTLDFEPKIFETFWFWTLVVVLLLFLFLLMFQIGTTMQEKRAVELQNKIDEKTLILKETVVELENSKNAVTNSLLEKEILLREIHHRVKNNLQLVISMMSVQALRANYKNIDEFIETTRIRIASMIIIHQSLYQGASLAEVDVDTYIKMFFKELKASFASSTSVSVESSTNNITFNISTAIPFGLIVNEIMTNALKHAFPDNKQGIIKINLQRQDDLNILTIEDNGIGFKPATMQKKSFGLDLISLLVRQLKGTMVLESENGTKYTITFADVAEEQSDFT